MIRLSIIAVAAFSSVAAAQEVNILSGEHGDFTRLVIMFADDQQWNLEKTSFGYSITTENNITEYRTDRIYPRIGRSRYRDVQQFGSGGALNIALEDDIDVTTFELRSGALVIDAKTSNTPIDHQALPVADLRPDAQNPPAVLETLPQHTPVIEISEDVQPTVTPSTAPPPVVSITLPQLTLATPDISVYWDSDSPAPTQESKAIVPSTVANPLSDLLKKPDSRVSIAEEELLRQLGRAASQGLVKFDMPTTGSKPTVSTNLSIPEPEPVLDDHLAVHSETVIDRDSSSLASAIENLSGRASCLPDQLFSLRDWEKEGDAFEMISNARRSLVGEFDKPNTNSALELAQIYLAFGFGVEARATVDAFSLTNRNSDVVRYLAGILEQSAADDKLEIVQMAGCDSDVALWALLGSDIIDDPKAVNVKAIARAFSDLPMTVRKQISVPLTKKLLSIEAGATATSIQHALARGELSQSNESRLINATINQEILSANTTSDTLNSIVSHDSELTPDAILLTVETAYRDGQSVDGLVIENAVALANELKPSIESDKLLRAAALGYAANEELPEAMRMLKNWPAKANISIKDETAVDIYTKIKNIIDNNDFLSFYFKNKNDIKFNLMPDKDLMANAERLLDLGFVSDARILLSSTKQKDDDYNILMAKSSILQGDAPSALSFLQDLPGPAAEKLRGMAFGYLGEDKSAMESYSLSSDEDREAEHAFQAGIWKENTDTNNLPRNTFSEVFFDQTSEPQIDMENNPISSAKSILETTSREVESFNILNSALKNSDRLMR
ncbi:hypothetical protein BFP70_06195 [Thioclava sp. SK-1]|uniref:hypothetical protein n=1 Tax=Thioclava sp. SK-1 TaxID=1889770 RepID=UPI000824EA59|nr:hypothetical protein [Thioclava sp. SK-1]OCX65735.1 hypothetical protein BFP70_06195 [Thioclava sp. SK-1]